jgi:hypothetical protein
MGHAPHPDLPVYQAPAPQGRSVAQVRTRSPMECIYSGQIESRERILTHAHNFFDGLDGRIDHHCFAVANRALRSQCLIDGPTGKTIKLICMLFSISAVMASTVRREALRGSGAAQDARCLTYPAQFHLNVEQFRRYKVVVLDVVC